MLVLGDSHATTPDRRAALLSAYEAVDPEVALHLGDLGHYDLPAPTWFVAGNNEDFDVVDALRTGESPAGVRNATLLASTVFEVQGLRVAGLSGNYAPTRFEKSRDELVGDRRRHFVREEVGQAARLEDVDVFLTHEAPEGLIYYGYEPGCEYVTDLVSVLDPERCLVGHHHVHREGEVAGVRTVALAPVWEGYYTMDPGTLALEFHETDVEAEAPE
jgi:Icc-related predicted phosphoesterase